MIIDSGLVLDKKIKIINLINIILSAVALILECMPNSMIKTIGSIEIIRISYHSYFSNPKIWNVDLMFAFFLAILTITNLVINIVLLIKNNKSLYVSSTIMISIMTFFSVLLILYNLSTPYNIIITAIFLFQTTSRFVGIFYNESKSRSKKWVEISDMLNILVLVGILILAICPDSIEAVNKYNINNISSFHNSVGISYLTFSDDNILFIIAYIFTIITFYLLLLSWVILSVDRKGLCIALLTISSVCLFSSTLICLMAGSQVTVYNIIITILFIVPVIIQSIKLKFEYKDIKLKTQ